MAAKRLLTIGLMATLFGAGYAFGNAGGADLVPSAEASPTLNAEPRAALPVQTTRVFELRTYTAPEGKLDDLLTRFRDHTMRIFEKHGIENVGYWVPQETPNTLIYIISHDSRQAATDSWASFRADPEWTEVARASQVDGQILAKATGFVFQEATNYWAIR